MCKFFSCVSDGHGEIKLFKLEDIVNVMAIGNPKSFEWNSHTSICQFHGINSAKEDKWNKWEYDPITKELTEDSLVTTDDRKSVLHYLDKYFHGKDIEYMRNIYNKNSGNRNSGNSNSGHWNSGDRNSGHWNSGNSNSGNRNSGHWNSGDMDNSFCTKKFFFIFDKPCTEEEYKKIFEIDRSWFNLVRFIWTNEMSADEKNSNPTHETTGGYLKVNAYKEAWKDCPKSELDKIKNLKNFNANKFFEITGIKLTK